MKTFTDNAGHTWQVVINVAAAKRVRDLLGVDLLEAGGGELLKRLAVDPILLVDVIYVLCKPQADAAQVGDEAFGEAMAGDVIDTATTALLEELVDFFPGPKRAVLRKALGKLKKLEQMGLDAGTQHLESGELERRMAALLEEQLGPPSGPPPDSSDSTPDP